MERLLLVLDELDDAVSVARHLWLGASRDLGAAVAWLGVAVAPGLMIYIARF